MDLSGSLGASTIPPVPLRVTSGTPAPAVSSESSKQMLPVAPRQSSAPPVPVSVAAGQQAGTTLPGMTRMVGSSPYNSAYGMASSPYNMMSNRTMYGPSMSRYPQYSSYGGYGAGYGGYGSYGSYGNYGSGYNNFLMEISNLPAFQSLQSVVNTFGSVSVMLESCYNAVLASFQAMVGVADQFSKVKVYFTQLFGAVATFRLVRLLAKSIPGLRRASSSLDPDQVWGTSEDSASPAQTKSRSSLNIPLLLYMGHLLAAPFIIWKLLQNTSGIQEKPGGPGQWMKGEGEHFIAKASYPFTASGDRELSLETGQLIVVAPQPLQEHQQSGWLLASRDEKVGLVPANYVKIISKRNG